MAAKSKWLAEMFHSFPHLDFDFQWTTKIFTPDDKGYIQALMFNGIILLFVAVVLFIGFSLYFLICSCYFCSRCHPPLKPKPHKSRCLRLLISIFAFLSCVALGVGFYGNNKASSGVGNFANAAVDIYDTWDLFKIKNTVAKQYLQEGANSTLCDLISALKGKNMSVPTSLENLARSVDSVLKDLNISSKKLSRSAVNLKTVADESVYYDNLRWWITIAIHFWHLLVVLVVFYSSWRERKYPFILLTMMSILCLFYMSGSISIEVPFSIGAGDICIAPEDAIYQSVDDPADKVVISYYLNCWNRSANPLSRPYVIAQLRLEQIDVILNNVSKDPELQHFNETKFYLDNIAKFLANAASEISGLVKALDCTYINQRFNEGVNEVCFTVLDGLSLLILAAMMLSVFLVSIIVCITPIWKSMARLRSILRKPGGGVTLVTGSYSGPPGREGLLNSSWDTSLDASYKSINEEQQGRTDETLPLVAQEEPPAYSAVHGSTEFLSVEEDRRRHLQAETET